MRPAFVASARRSALVAAALAAAACGPRDAQVGLVPLAGGDGAVGGDGSSSLLFSSELDVNGGLWNVFTPLPGARVTFGAPMPGARDGRVAELRFPGAPALGAADRSNADLNTGIEARQFFRYGTFRARVRFATCAAGEEVASAVFMYFSDGRDGNDNGIADVSELDLHVLCGTPSFVVLSAWSDYEEHPPGGAATFLKVSHAVDTASGELYETLAPGDPAFTKIGSAPELVMPGFPAAGTFYEVGIDWQAARVRFFIVMGGVERTLWTLTDAAYIPQVPLPPMFNLWHPATHWVPTRAPADYPAEDGVMLVDWAEWRGP